MVRLWKALLIGTLLGIMLLWSTSGSGKAQEISRAASRDAEPPGGAVLRCPEFVHIYEPDIWRLALAINPEYEECRLDNWFLLRGETSDYDEMTPVLYSKDNSFSYYDRQVKPGSTYYYQLRLTLDGQSQKCKVIHPIKYKAIVYPECWGYVHETWTLDNGTYEIGAVTVTGTGKLQIDQGAVIHRPGGKAGISCNGPNAALEINGGTLMTVSLMFGGGNGYVRDAHIRNSSITIYESAPGGPIDISGNTFVRPLSPQSDSNMFRLGWEDAQAVIRGNQGAFDVELFGQSQATISENRFEGRINVYKSGQARLYDNVISGTLTLDGYGAPTGEGAAASVISTTIVVTEGTSFSYNYAVRADTNTELTMVRTRLENQKHTNGRVLESHPSQVGASIRLIDGWLSGWVNMTGNTDLTLLNNDEIRGWIQCDDEVTALIGGNEVYGDLRLKGNSRTTFINNVMPQGAVWLYGDAGGNFTHNTFLQSPQYSNYSFEFSDYPAPDSSVYSITQNCIERRNGLYVSDMTGKVKIDNNWWGDKSGPDHFPDNREGQGALISIVRSPNDVVVYRPFLKERPPYCTSTPNRVQVTMSELIDRDGGALVLGPIYISFPGGAVTKNVRVTYAEHSRGGTSAVAAAVPPTGDLIGNLFFDLSAIEEGTSNPVKQFAKPYSLTMYYDASRLGAREDTVTLYWWNGKRWVREASSAVHPDENKLTATLDHMTLFALLGEGEQLYLPEIAK